MPPFYPGENMVKWEKYREFSHERQGNYAFIRLMDERKIKRRVNDMMKHAFVYKVIGLIAALVLVASCAFAQSAVIDNGSDSASMLNLRAQPDRSAAALGKFLSGTQVEVLGDAGDGWSQVQFGQGMGTVTGYVMTQYLSGRTNVNATYAASVVSPYGTQSVVLRDRPSNSYNAVAMLMVGDSVLVIGEMDAFRYVKTGSGCVGCLLKNELE